MLVEMIKLGFGQKLHNHMIFKQLKIFRHKAFLPIIPVNEDVNQPTLSNKYVSDQTSRLSDGDASILGNISSRWAEPQKAEPQLGHHVQILLGLRA